jgi:hypothetical protein
MVLPSDSEAVSREGVGGQVLATEDRVLPVLPDRCRIWGIRGGGEGGSIVAIITRPATRDTRCCEDLLRGGGKVGEREGGGRCASDTPGWSGFVACKDECDRGGDGGGDGG